MVDFDKLKKRNKVAISITVDFKNLEFLKEDMKLAGVSDMPLSTVFDGLLEDFVKFRKNLRENKEGEKIDENKPKEEEDGDKSKESE